ncbi:MAG: glycosyltransferase family 8 protein [Prevotella sp.]|nr:glycosyltransferase family 8 protein [Prevotella sp.]
MLDTQFYNIVCIADENYAQHAAVLLCSLLENNRENTFRIFLMTYSMKDITKKKLHQMVERSGSQLVIIENDYEDASIASLKSETSTKAWNSIMYLKTLIPQYLPDDVNRFLFLDVDMIVRTNIDPLYNIDMQGNVIAACEDYLYQQVHKDRLDLSDNDLYINSGVMVVDLGQWREMEKQRPMADFLKDNARLLNNDQDVFALYFKNKIMLLPTSQWNATTFFFEQKPRVLDKYLPEVDVVRHHPYIVHFCEPIKPWFKECKHPYRNEYRKYLRMTPWKVYKYPSCKTVYGKPVWKYTLKYWLNRWGILKEPMALINI